MYSFVPAGFQWFPRGCGRRSLRRCMAAAFPMDGMIPPVDPDVPQEQTETLQEVEHVRNVFPETWLWINASTGWISFPFLRLLRWGWFYDVSSQTQAFRNTVSVGGHPRAIYNLLSSYRCLSLWISSEQPSPLRLSFLVCFGLWSGFPGLFGQLFRRGLHRKIANLRCGISV
ncbi:hypothetical protein BaRGS_00016148 [Batillaria attramentaria]|uniref:Uncharacterized protein n=1 Tax=Batillaria attramentaria TaxID=370345 RepID=A0ABD0L0T1_9CAEN